MKAELARGRERRRLAAWSRRAPTGVMSTMHTFYAGMLGLILMTCAIAEAINGSKPLVPWPIFEAIAAADALYLVIVVLWILLWRRMLAFDLIGYDEISGESGEGHGMLPWIEFRVRVVLAEPDPRAEKAASLALDILASRANESLTTDDDANATSDQFWKSQGPLEVRGEGWKRFYIDGLFRTWFRNEMNRVARAHPAVRAVQFEARYTGGAFFTRGD